MTHSPFASLVPLAAAIALSGCAGAPARDEAGQSDFGAIESSVHRGGDDLLSAGLGAAGLANPVPPAFADPAHPTPAELRRRALWSNWRGIADLAPGGGYGSVYGNLAPAPGREYHAFARLPGAHQPHRVMLQLPDDFDAKQRCVVVAASSGSRGIYGAIALAGSWGLGHRCAVAYTDKGAGTGYVELDSGQGTRVDGSRGAAGEALEFALPADASAAPGAIGVKHAHSGDNPESDWGRHVQQAAAFVLQVLDSAHPEAAPFTFANTRVIAVGVSNGGGAVLRAAELPGDWLDGVVAISPNIHSASAGRPLYDYVTEAALLMPCALAAPDFDAVAMARPGGAPNPAGLARCASLRAKGLLAGDSPAAQASNALAKLHSRGWTNEAIAAGALSTAFDLWRAVAVTYASAYARSEPGHMPCGYSFQALDAKGQAQAATDVERAAWWSDASGIPPGAGIGIADAQASGADPALPGLLCLRALWTESGADAYAVREGIAAARAELPRPGLPVLLIHGADDGLVPEAFSGAAYASWAKSEGRDLRYWRVRNAQHFDAFLGLPPIGASYLPLLPYAYRGLDAMLAHLVAGKPLPGDADIGTRKRALTATGLEALSAEHLGQMP